MQILTEPSIKISSQEIREQTPESQGQILETKKSTPQTTLTRNTNIQNLRTIQNRQLTTTNNTTPKPNPHQPRNHSLILNAHITNDIEQNLLSFGCKVIIGDKETKNHKQNTGIGNYQTDKAHKAKWSILKTLSDGQWHRNMELKEKTKLSSRTLAKHLNQMTNFPIIEKKTDVESGKYPIPVLYKAKPNFLTYIKSSMTRQEVANKMESALNETKDPLIVLELIHASSQLYFIDLLARIQQYKNITYEEIYFLADIFLWANYKQYTAKLIETSHKMINAHTLVIDDPNINQLLISQAKRQIKISEKTLKIYEKIQQQNTQKTKKAFL